MNTIQPTAAALLVALLPLVMSSSGHAATFHVATNGSNANPGTLALPFKTIAHGIESAADGDTIQVAAGTYFESLIRWSHKSLILQGAGADRCIIDAQGRNICMSLVSVPDTARLAGFTFQNGAGKGAGLEAISSSPTVSHCTFRNNVSAELLAPGATGAGGILMSGNLRVLNCAFIGNRANIGGGGIYNVAGSLKATNCFFLGNFSNDGGGAIRSAGAATVVNCTIVNNDGYLAGGIYGMATVINCILWGNTGWSGEIFSDIGQLSVSYSNVRGGFPGPGNINTNPMFLAPGFGFYSLQSGSPCVNRGTLVPGGPATDLNGAPRIMGSAPDMGAYETWSPDFGAWCVDAQSGNDANNGSPATPFRTVTRALSASQIGESIHIRQGNYGSDQPRITQNVHLRYWGDAGLARIGTP